MAASTSDGAMLHKGLCQISWIPTYLTKEGWSTPTIATNVDDFVGQCLDPSLTTCEMLTSDTMVRPYFDYEAYHEGNGEDLDIQGIENQKLTAIRNTFAIPGHEPYDVVMCTAHRPVVSKWGKSMFKISCRFFVKGFKMMVKDIPGLIQASEFLRDENFDTSCYGSRQPLGCVNCRKPGEDPRILKIVTEGHTLKDTVVQYLEGGEFDCSPKDHATDGGGGAQQQTNKADDRYVPSEVEEIQKLVALCSVARAQAYHSWRDMRTCLKNICSTIRGEDDSFYDIFLEFSRKAPNFDEAACEKIWCEAFHHTSSKALLTEGSLRYWARLDDPEGYKALLSSSLKALMFSSADGGGTHVRVAKVVFAMFQGDFVYLDTGSESKSNWYFFDQGRHRWTPYGREELRSRLVEEVASEYDALSEITKKKASRMKDGAQESAQKLLLARSRALKQISKKLETSGYCAGVMQMCQIMFRRNAKEFVEALDSNPHLLGFENGVYDFEKAEFRAGRPEDMVSFSTGYDYMDEVDTRVKGELMKFLESLMNKQENLTFLLRSLAYTLVGVRWMETCIFWTGTGANGKGMLMTLMLAMLGNYGVTANKEILTCKKTGVDGTNSELAKCKGVRLLNVSEPADTDSIQVDTFKLLVGGDKITARGLYKDPITYDPHFQLFIQTNLMPNLSSMDGGVMRRPLVQEFPFQFVQAPIPNSHQKLWDTSLKEKFKNDRRYAQQLFLVLMGVYHDEIQGFREGNKMPIPPDVQAKTDEYREENNETLSFLRDMYEITGSPEDIVLLDEMFTSFRYSSTSSSSFAAKDKKWFKKQLMANQIRVEKYTKRDPKFRMKQVVVGVKERLMDMFM